MYFIMAGQIQNKQIPGFIKLRRNAEKKIRQYMRVGSGSERDIQ